MPTKHRVDRICWEDHHMLLALLTAQRSPDPNTQVGACIVGASNGDNNRVLGLGYNGWPRGISQDALPWGREGSPEQTKYPFVVHAEKNAIYNSKGHVEGAILYATMYPCNECAKDIIQAGIKEVIWLTDSYRDSWQVQAASRMFQHLDIVTRQHKWEHDRTLSCLQQLLNQIGCVE